MLERTTREHYYAPSHMTEALSDDARLTSIWRLSVWRLSVCRVHRA